MANTVIGVKETTKKTFDYEYDQAVRCGMLPVGASHDLFVRKLLEKWVLEEVKP